MPDMHVFTRQGVETLPIGDAGAASVVGRHWNAVQKFLDSGDPTALDEFRGARVRGRRLETDPDAIEDFWAAGQLNIRDIYDLPASEVAL